ncbi:hypothetical protein LINPERPRIM_LOCUS410, partial [Linum perenne]
ILQQAIPFCQVRAFVFKVIHTVILLLLSKSVLLLVSCIRLHVMLFVHHIRHFVRADSLTAFRSRRLPNLSSNTQLTLRSSMMLTISLSSLSCERDYLRPHR